MMVATLTMLVHDRGVAARRDVDGAAAADGRREGVRLCLATEARRRCGWVGGVGRRNRRSEECGQWPHLCERGADLAEEDKVDGRDGEDHPD